MSKNKAPSTRLEKILYAVFLLIAILLVPKALNQGGKWESLFWGFWGLALVSALYILVTRTHKPHENRPTPQTRQPKSKSKSKPKPKQNSTPDD